MRQSRRAIHFARDEKRYPNAYTDRAAMGAILKSQGASMELSYKGVDASLLTASMRVASSWKNCVMMKILCLERPEHG